MDRKLRFLLQQGLLGKYRALAIKRLTFQHASAMAGFRSLEQFLMSRELTLYMLTLFYKT